MTVNEYLTTYTLLTNLPPTINYDFFKNRFMSVYGTRKIRGDVPIENIATIAQSVFLTNELLLAPLFVKNINPLQTWGENGTNDEKENGDNTNTNTSNSSGSTIANIVENKSVTSGESHGTTNNSVYAFNATENAAPTDISVTDTNANSTTTNTANNTTTDTTEIKNIGEIKHNITRNSEYEKTGFNINDYERAFNLFVAPYDYLIRLIVNEICVTTFELYETGVYNE